MKRPVITLVDTWIYLKAAISGFLLTASAIFGTTVSHQVFKSINLSYNNLFDQHILAVLLIATVILFTFTWLRGAFSQLHKIVISKRIDVFMIAALGALSAERLTPQLTTAYQLVTSKAQPVYFQFVLFIPMAFFFVTALDAIYMEAARTYRKKSWPLFVNDVELQSSTSDLLGNSDMAIRFAGQIWNGGSADSLVFGLDAPWGIGKSSFINFTLEHLIQIGGRRLITFKFNPLKYHDKSKLLEKLIDGLRDEISTTIYAPELTALLTRYSKIINSKVGLTAFGIRLDSSEASADSAYSELERTLARLNQKIVVIIDDLDRIDYAEVKEILFTIKKSFMLPNVSYILSYDTENILASEKNSDSAKIREFMEKFVNIKTSIFLDSSKLSGYITTNFNAACQSNLLVDPVTITRTAGVLTVLKDIFDSNEFYRYYPIIGDIRKIKRLINTVLSLEIEKTEFESSDVDKADLLHLLLIYLNFPHIFRVIYNTETNGRNGFFSAVGKYHPWYPKLDSAENPPTGWQNSTKYKEYFDKLEPAQKLLLEKIFSLPSRLAHISGDVSEQDQAMLACFNSTESANNLERYLDLIVKTAKPVPEKQYRFYATQANIVASGEELRVVFQDDRFDLNAGEYTHRYFWRVFSNESRKMRLNDVDRAIDYLIETTPAYSIIEHKNLEIGLRNTAPIYLLKLLNDAGWEDKAEMHVDNTPLNIANIADHIFGEKNYRGRGIIDSFSENSRGVLGLYDLLIFRLYCCANRDSPFFNLHRALVFHADPKGIAEGPVTRIAIGQMREISQKITLGFINQYVNKDRNILAELEALTFSDLSGEAQKFITEKIDNNELTQEEIDHACEIRRNGLKSFITYQLGGISTDSGVTCGFYDLLGDGDANKIAHIIDDYLFEVCFNPSKSSNAYESFLDYLLISYPIRFSWNSTKPEPSIQSFTNVLYKESLAEYWKRHQKIIREMDFENMDKIIRTSNFTLSYKDNLIDVYNLLDEIIR